MSRLWLYRRRGASGSRYQQKNNPNDRVHPLQIRFRGSVFIFATKRRDNGPLKFPSSIIADIGWEEGGATRMVVSLPYGRTWGSRCYYAICPPTRARRYAEQMADYKAVLARLLSARLGIAP